MHSIPSWSRISVTWGGGVVSVLSVFLLPFFFLTLNVNLNCKIEPLPQHMYTLFNISSSSQNILTCCIVLKFLSAVITPEGFRTEVLL